MTRKKILSALLLSTVLLTFTAYGKSKKADSKVSSAQKVQLDFSLNGGKTLDGYWDSYYETKDTFYLDAIIAYADCEDGLLAAINSSYEKIVADENLKNFCLEMELTEKNKQFESRYDLDSLSIILLQSGNDEYASYVIYLYSFFLQDLLIRNAVKSSAYWSLSSNAEQYEDVMAYLMKKLPDLSPKTRNTFSEIYNIK